MIQAVRLFLLRIFGFLLAIFGLLSMVAFFTYDKSHVSFNTAGTAVPTTDYILQTWGDILVQFIGVSAIFVAVVFCAWGGKILWGRKIQNFSLRRNMLIVTVLFVSVGVRFFNIPISLFAVTQDQYIYAHGLLGHVVYSYTLSYADAYAVWGAYGLLAISVPMAVYTLAIAGHEWKQVLYVLGGGIGWIYKKIAKIVVGVGTIVGKIATSKRDKHAQAQTDHTLHTLHSSLDNSADAADASHDKEVSESEATPSDMFAAASPVRESPPLKVSKKSTIAPATSDVFQLPILDLLQDIQSQRTVISDVALDATRRQLTQTLLDFKVNGDIIDTRIGPVVTTYELQLAAGVRENRVIGLADDIARTMGAESIRISRIPGRTVIGIELPNVVPETVSFKDIISSDTYCNADMALPLVLGKTVEGAVAIADLASMPHLLIAGTTGSGKSVGINAMILSLLYRYRPDQLKLIMVDPKMLEFSMYEDIPHLLSPVVTEPSKAVVALKWAVNEMNRRYAHMSKLGVRNIGGYNSKVADLKKSGDIPMETIATGFYENGDPIYEQRPQELEHYPYIVVIVDEMADLMLTAGKDINDSIQSLAQKARAAGIHLILATQRPSTDVITGTIRANFPARISYRVTSKIDSRVILNEGGAEQLLGRGDMLFFSTKITRNHAPFVQDSEVENVCDWLRKQEPPEYVDAVTDGGDSDGDMPNDGGDIGGGTGGDNGAYDPLYNEAVALVTRTRKASTSFVQRSLKIGYNRAANIIEQLEQDGVISAATATGKRTVLAPEGDYE